MKFLMDGGNLEDIRFCNEFFPLAGVTTNPTLVAKEKADFWELIKEIRSIIGPDKMLHVQSVQDTAEKIVEEAKLLKGTVGGDFYVKIPISAESLKATRLLKKEGIGVTMTAIFTPPQALIAATAGADFVAPYVNRQDNIVGDGVGVVDDIVKQFKNYNLNCQVLAASFKNIEQIHRCALCGCHTVTIGADLFRGIVSHPMTDASVEGFKADWKAVYGDKSILDFYEVNIMKAIINETLVMPDHYIPEATLLMEDGIIVDFGRKLEVPAGAEIIDAEGLYVGPGLVDIHTHADGTHFFHEEPEVCCQTLLEHGVTSVMPALYYSLNKEEYLGAVKNYKKLYKEGRLPNVIGLYMEGPYLNPDYGCEREKNVWKDGIFEKDYAEILEESKEMAKVWCVSPEREGTLEFVRNVKKAIPNIVFSVAHSEATPEQIEELMPYGLKLGTHHTNATGTLEPFPECRGACVDEAVNYNNDIFAELICDSVGIHVHPYNLRLIKKIKGADKIILISDALVANGPPIPGCEEAFDINFDFEGEIAGSKLTLDQACRNMMKHTGGSVCDVFRYASYNPARLLGMHDIGSIRKGSRANLIFVDHWFNVQKTILKGEIAK